MNGRHPGDATLTLTSDNPESNDNHSHCVFHSHVKKYSLYYSRTTYAEFFTCIFCHPFLWTLMIY